MPLNSQFVAWRAPSRSPWDAPLGRGSCGAGSQRRRGAVRGALLVAALLASSAPGQVDASARQPAPYRSHTLFGATHIGVAQHHGAPRIDWFVWDDVRAWRVESAALPLAEVHRIRPLGEPPEADAKSARFLYCGQTQRGTGVVGLFTAHRTPKPHITLDGALTLADTLVLDAVYHAGEERLYVLDGRGDSVRTAAWRDGQSWPKLCDTALDASDDACLATVDTLAVVPGQPGVLAWREPRNGEFRVADAERVRISRHGEGGWLVTTELDEDTPAWSLRSHGWAQQPSLTITAHCASDEFEVVDVDSGAALLHGVARRSEQVTLALPPFCAAWPGRQVRVHGARVGRSPAHSLVPHFGRPWRSSDAWVARLSPLQVDSAACRLGGELLLRTTLTRTKPAGHGDSLAGFVLLALRAGDGADPISWGDERALLEPTAIAPFVQDHSWPRPEVEVRTALQMDDDAALVDQVVLLQIAIEGPGGELLFSDVIATTIWPESGPHPTLPSAQDHAARARATAGAPPAWRRWLTRAGFAAESSPLFPALARARTQLAR